MNKQTELVLNVSQKTEKVMSRVGQMLGVSMRCSSDFVKPDFKPSGKSLSMGAMEGI